MEYHINMPDHDIFADAMLDICLAANPVLAFMDGIVGMEGAGPSAGEPRKVGLCFASDSPYALDMAAVQVIGLNFNKVPTIRRAILRGFTPTSPDEIIFPGEKPKDVFVADFVVPEAGLVFPIPAMGSKNRILSKIINKFFQPRPIFINDLCVGCADCAKSCPAKVITMENKKPIVALNGCIRCFCCQELCPKKAVKIHRPAILKFLAKL